ncbi:FkbM family methyltransferase [Emticicia sp. 21SJ11W-3]|uniref:FkbM family methyltransferase n=1 Tax=Emticicia sp. 21SJ11W-3 TaxID=2916755 RepID=UPI00209D1635|nr:FkbM family methyltransferase [Emticicia sp. 21SJ11W-3]UTA69430.1 FkbM family methyltransferase [Emticicia sp. 21SJ11W-3]
MYSAIFKLLPLFDAIRLSILFFVRRYIFKFGKVIFSQTGEEILIQWILKDVKNGFYLDVGCHHPYKISNTFQLYLKGWHGIAIDANPALIAKWKRKRKNDIPIMAAVSDQEKEVTFYEFKESEVNTMDEGMMREWKQKFNYRSERKLTTQTLTSVLDAHLPKGQKIDLMTVDVEGNDFNVIKSIDLAVYRPKLIVVEIHNTDLSDIHENEIYKYLSGKNYKLVSFATMNGYFLDATQA